jgi:hypothetical protein
MAPTRKIALAAGIAYLVTFAASIPQLKLFADVIADPTGYISNPGSNAGVQWGSVLEILTAASGVATAVLLYPVTRRVSRSAAIGFVTPRVVEAALILVGVVSILSVITLQQHFAGATGAQAQALGVTGEALVAMRQWTFLLGPGVMAGVNDLLLGYILYRSGLVGRCRAGGPGRFGDRALPGGAAGSGICGVPVGEGDATAAGLPRAVGCAADSAGASASPTSNTSATLRAPLVSAGSRVHAAISRRVLHSNLATSANASGSPEEQHV